MRHYVPGRKRKEQIAAYACESTGHNCVATTTSIPLGAFFWGKLFRFYLDAGDLGGGLVHLFIDEAAYDGAQPQHHGKGYHEHPAADPHEEIFRLSVPSGSDFGPAVPVHTFFHINLV